MNQRNENKEKKHNYFYRITNQINWKFYYGIRSCKIDPEEDIRYFGSGKLIHEAIKKYGKENFVKTIIADYPTRKEASDHEKLAVTMLQVEDENCYNIKTGGDNECVFSEETKRKISESHIGKKASRETKKKMSEARLGEKHPMFGRRGENCPAFGKKATEATKKKVSEAQQGERNSMFGKTHSKEARKSIGEAKRGDKNHNFGKPMPEETKRKISESLSGERNARFGKTHDEKAREKMRNKPDCKPCQILGVLYISMSEASRQLGLSKNDVSKRLRSKTVEFSEWEYLIKE